VTIELRDHDPPAIPARFRVSEDAASLNVGWRWFTPVYGFMLVFCFIWDSALINWYVEVLSKPTHLETPLLAFPILHVVAGVVLTYVAIAGLVNRTTVEVRTTESGALPTYRDAASPPTSRITVRHGPLPWRGNRTVAAAELRQLDTHERQVRGKRSVTLVYDVVGIGHDDRKVVLVSGLARDEALYLEQRLEARLGMST
jgi:hypothetical protein